MDVKEPLNNIIKEVYAALSKHPYAKSLISIAAVVAAGLLCCTLGEYFGEAIGHLINRWR